jgi:hypothetical protein
VGELEEAAAKGGDGGVGGDARHGVFGGEAQLISTIITRLDGLGE